MIFVGKAPYRVSLLGGSSDLDWFVKEKGFGICVGFALKEYSYSVLNVLPKDSKRGIIEYSTKEIYSNINDIVHPIVREVLIDLKINNYIELKTFGFASGGSGLGGSASFLLSLLSSLTKAFGMDMNYKQIIEKACFIEINKLKKSIGKQDQYLCAYEGFNSFTFFDDDKVERNELSDQKLKTLKRLAEDFYLIPTNKKRNSDLVLNQIRKDEKILEKILEIREIANRFVYFKDDRDYKNEELFHKSIKDSWIIKKSISNVINPDLNNQYEIINKLIPNNWIRLIGAGGGGYFLISSKVGKEKIKKISNENAIKGIFKATISNEGISNFHL